MTTELRNVLSVAAAARKMGCVFFIDGQPYHWRCCPKAATSPEHAYGYTSSWLTYYQPQLLVTERIGSNSRKGENTMAMIDAVCKAAQDANIKWVVVDRMQMYPNKYEEAGALALRFPEFGSYVPKARKSWESEPRGTILFEALSLAKPFW